MQVEENTPHGPQGMGPMVWGPWLRAHRHGPLDHELLALRLIFELDFGVTRDFPQVVPKILIISSRPTYNYEIAQTCCYLQACFR